MLRQYSSSWELGTGIPLHSTNFDFEEDLLLSGFALYQALLTR